MAFQLAKATGVRRVILTHRTPEVREAESKLAASLTRELRAIGRRVARKLAHLGKSAQVDDDDARDEIELRDWPEELEKKNVHGSKWIRPEKRAAIYLRDGSKCVYCGSHERLSLDHVIPRELGGTHSEKNLVTACVSCNSQRQDTPLKKWIDNLHQRGANVEGLGVRIKTLTKTPLDMAAGKQAIADKKVSAVAPAIEAAEPAPLPERTAEGKQEAEAAKERGDEKADAAGGTKPESEKPASDGEHPRDDHGRFASKLAKSAEEEDEAEAALDAEDWTPIARASETELVAVAEDGAQRTLLTLGIADDETITKQTFKTAVEFARARAAELVGKSWDEDGELVDNPDADMAITDSLREEIREAVAQALEDGEGAAELSDRIEALAGFSEERATMIARTECLLGETPVDAAVVRAAFRRWYDGDVVELVTAGGRHLAATPNHPMLTRRGWVAAGELTDRDDLLCDGRKQSLGAIGHEHENARPPTIGEVFGALLDAGTAERYPGSRLEFHGDGVESDVDVVRPDRELMLGEVAEIRKPAADGLFAEADQGRATFCPACGRLFTIDQQPCLCRRTQYYASHREPVLDPVALNSEAFTKRDCRLTREVPRRDLLNGETISKGRSNEAVGILGVRGVTQVADHAGSADRFEHAFIGNAQHSSDNGGALAGRIEADRSIGIKRPGTHLLAHEAGSTARAKDAGLGERLLQPGRADVELLRNNVAGHAGFVEFDRLVSIKRLPFIGHVFNLETPYGYFCVAGGAYTGNTIRAHAQGQMAAMRASGVVERKAWSTSEDGDVCDECLENEDAGDIALDDEFPSGDDAPPCHPNDRCAVVAVITERDDEEEPDGEGDDEDEEDDEEEA